MAHGDYDEEGEVDDWCFFCKNGGDLLLCDFQECERAYHCECVETNSAGLKTWHCPRHYCVSCKRSPTVALCYSCPSASCSKCLDALGFVRIHGKYGFCSNCLELAMYLERLAKNKPKTRDRRANFTHFKEYYWIIKRKYGVTVDDLVAVKKGREKQIEMKGRGKQREVKKRKKCLDNADEDKDFQNMKLNSAGTSQNEIRDVMIWTAENVKKGREELIEMRGRGKQTKVKGREKRKYWSMDKPDEDKLIEMKGNEMRGNEMKGRGKQTEVEGREKYWSLDKLDEDKEFQKMKLNSAGASQNEVLIRDVMIRTTANVEKGVERLIEMKGIEMRGSGKQREVKEREKYWSLDITDEDKEFQKLELSSAGTSQNEVLIRELIIRIPALTPDNVQRIFLTRNVIQKLLMDPDSFEEKVRGTFVGIELPKKARSNKTTRQLVQITGIRKTSLQNDQICIKLQVKNSQDDISVDMVSDMDFQAYLCEDLRQQVKNGLIKMPDVGEFERIARALSVVLVDDYIIRETRKLQQKMNRALEMGRRHEFLLLEQNKKELQTSKKRLQLINYFQEVDVEELLADNMSGNAKNVTLKSEHFSESIPNSATLFENNMFDSAPRPKDDTTTGNAVNVHFSESIPNSVTLFENNMIDSARMPIADTTSEDAVDATRKSEHFSESIPNSVLLFGNCTIDSGSSSKQHGVKFIDIKHRHQPVMDDNKQVVDAAGDQVQETVPMNVADHSSVQIFEVKNDCDVLLLSPDILEKQTMADVMLEEFENNARVVKDTQVELLRIEGFSVAEKLAILEQKVDRILQQIDRMPEEAAKQIVLK